MTANEFPVHICADGSAIYRSSGVAIVLADPATHRFNLMTERREIAQRERMTPALCAVIAVAMVNANRRV